MSAPAVLVVSSQVVRGAVGGRAAFALERNGHRLWTLPTVLLPWHPGHGPATRIVPPDEAFQLLAEDLARAPWLGEIGGVITGYLGSPGQAAVIARLLAAIRSANPDVLHLADPVIGDAGGAYVPPAVIDAQRDQLVAGADIATPNRHELALLTGLDTSTPDRLAEAARRLGPERVVVTSAAAMMRGKIGTALVTARGVTVAETREMPRAPNGTGDLFAALFLSRLLRGESDDAALAGATASTFETIARSSGSELDLAGLQDALVRPAAMVDLRRLALPGSAGGAP